MPQPPMLFIAGMLSVLVAIVTIPRLHLAFTAEDNLGWMSEQWLAEQRASRLSWGVPEAAVVKPGSSRITHEPLSSSVRPKDTDGLSVVTLISVPARTLVAPVTGNSLPLRLSTTGG